MPRYKRTFDEADLGAAIEPVVQTHNVETQSKLRNMWEMASLMQYIYLFGSVVKIDNDLDIDDLEAECLSPQPSRRLAQIGLQLLKFVSSHRGLTLEIFDEYTRRQYVAKAPHRNPFGEEEEPAKFDDFDVYTKIRVLHQLSTWTLWNSERLRGMMPQEEDQLGWRIEPIGWDKEDRAYFVLDDDRLYRRTDEPVPPPTPKQKARTKPKTKPAKKPKSRGTRSSKRLKLDDEEEEEEEMEIDDNAPATPEAGDDDPRTNGQSWQKEDGEEPGFGFTSKTWECIAITLEEYRDFLASIFRSRDPNEKQLRRTIEEDVLPIIEKRADQVKQRQFRKMRELENLQKMATAKRSSRLADKAEKEKIERDEREAEEKKQRELKMAHEEQERQRKIEDGHESRRLTREQRLKDREVKRILHEEELAKLEEAATRAAPQGPSSEAGLDGSTRMSERQITSQKERHQKELEKMAEEEEDWVFDCAICGVHGENLDDGTHSIACERCNVWQHSKCHGFSPKQAESDGFHFVCGTCKRREAEAKKPKIPTLKLGKRKSPEVQIPPPHHSSLSQSIKSTPLPEHIARQLDHIPPYQPTGFDYGSFNPHSNGTGVYPNGHIQQPHHPQYPPVSNFAPQPRPAQAWQSSAPSPSVRSPSAGYMNSPPPHPANGYGSLGQHQQQHQHMHASAVASAGGHYTYQSPGYGQQMYSRGRGMSGAPYQGQAPPPQSRHSHVSPQSSQPSDQQSPRLEPHGSGMSSTPNGIQSPTKQTSRLSTNSTQYGGFAQYPRPSFQVGQYPGHDARMSHAPSATTQSQFPGSSTQQTPSQPLPPQYHQSQQVRAAHSPSQLSNTPPNLQQPLASKGAITPRPAHPSPAGSNANHVAADGMSGPWPEASKAIPQKPSQSPVPHQSVRPIVDGRVLPPVNLAPSPHQQQQSMSGPQSVPVKKMPALEGSPSSPALQLPLHERSSHTDDVGTSRAVVVQSDGAQAVTGSQQPPTMQEPSNVDQPLDLNGPTGANLKEETAVQQMLEPLDRDWRRPQ